MGKNMIKIFVIRCVLERHMRNVTEESLFTICASVFANMTAVLGFVVVYFFSYSFDVQTFQTVQMCLCIIYSHTM